MCVDRLIVLVELPRVQVFVNGIIQLLVDLIFILLEHPMDIHISLKLSPISLQSISVFYVFHFWLHLDAQQSRRRSRVADQTYERN